MQTMTTPAVKRAAAAIREVSRRRRLASQQGRLFNLFLEHNLLEEARESRTRMLEHLRCARREWRTALGLTT